MRFFCVILTALALSSCSRPEFLTPEELQLFILDEENNLKKSEEVNNYRIEVTYRPTDLLVNQEIGDELVDGNKLEQLQKKYNGYYYFILSLSKNKKEALHQMDGDMERYSELVQTLSFEMTQYANLTTSTQDTIPVGDFILNRTYGVSASTDILFAFNKEKSRGKDWVQFNLNEFGLGVGNQRFRFSTKDLDNAPKINFALTSTNN